MKPPITLGLALLLSGALCSCCSDARWSPVSEAGNNQNLSRQIADILVEIQKVKPGMTRAELMQVFTTEGGLSTAGHRTFVDRHCSYIKVDVDFDLSSRTQGERSEERPADTIRKISRPYLDWNIAD